MENEMPMPPEPTFTLTLFNLNGEPDVISAHHLTFDVKSGTLTFDRAPIPGIPDEDYPTHVEIEGDISLIEIGYNVVVHP